MSGLGISNNNFSNINYVSQTRQVLFNKDYKGDSLDEKIDLKHSNKPRGEFESMSTCVENGKSYILNKYSSGDIEKIENVSPGDNEILCLEGMKCYGINALNYMIKYDKLDLKDNPVPFSVTEDNGINLQENSISLVNGTKITLKSGITLEWTHNKVKVLKSSLPTKEQLDAQKIASYMEMLTRIANRQMYGYNFNGGEKHEVVDALKSAGIDISKNFYVNGKKFWINEKTSSLKWDVEYIPKENHISGESIGDIKFIKMTPKYLASKFLENSRINYEQYNNDYTELDNILKR